MRIFGKDELRDALEVIGGDGFCADLAEIALSQIHLLSPPEEISTLDYSERYRLFRNENGTRTKWRRDHTPYLVDPMHALDNPKVRAVVVPKPARSGGTVVAENYALKKFEFGPAGDVMWYLAGPGEVGSYSNRNFKWMFEDHDGVASKIGDGPSDNKLTMKKIGAHSIELMPMNSSTTTNRQAQFIVFDEPDSYNKKFASNFMEQGRQRQRQIGNVAKIYACSHPDIGWAGGISQAWLQSSRGIFIMRCVECGFHASPYPTKHWPDIPRYKLHYESSPERTPIGERLKRAGKTASMLCPHCGSFLDDDQRKAMADEGSFMHEGQSLDIRAGIIGEPDENEVMGFWVHVLMVGQVKLSDLARELEAAVEFYQRTGKTEKLKQVLVRTFGEAFEGAGTAISLDAASLRKRTKDAAQVVDDETPVQYFMGEVPPGVRYLTAAVDVGGSKFDVLIRGWDLERRSWLIDRFTIKQRTHDDGIERDIRPPKVQEDWSVLESKVIDRLVPIKGQPGMAMPIAVTTIDAGDGNVTWKAYEFARRMDGKRWATWRRVRCIKGSTSEKAPQLPPTPTVISKDSEGSRIDPTVTLHVLGVSSLKDDTIDSLAIEDGGPGQCYFARNTPSHAYDEFFGEVKVEGKWSRNGPNETLDLYAYTEAGRLMLEPDRKDRNWTAGFEPVWARPVSLQPKGGDPSTSAPGDAQTEQRKPVSFFERFDREVNGEPND